MGFGQIILSVTSLTTRATPADQRRFADELTAALARLAARYHDPHAPQGRTFRVFGGGHPAVPSRSTELKAGREADSEAT